jgi:hypothetical protein
MPCHALPSFYLLPAEGREKPPNHSDRLLRWHFHMTMFAMMVDSEARILRTAITVSIGLLRRDDREGLYKSIRYLRRSISRTGGSWRSWSGRLTPDITGPPQAGPLQREVRLY